VTLTVSDEALDEIARVGFDPLYGARPLKRAVQEHLENPIARMLLEGKAGPADTIRVTAAEGKFGFDVVKGEKR
jgi:ATP-dependent Clp protease ATP-binding subunit ClpB